MNSNSNTEGASGIISKIYSHFISNTTTVTRELIGHYWTTGKFTFLITMIDLVDKTEDIREIYYDAGYRLAVAYGDVAPTAQVIKAISVKDSSLCDTQEVLQILLTKNKSERSFGNVYSDLLARMNSSITNCDKQYWWYRKNRCKQTFSDFHSKLRTLVTEHEKGTMTS